MHRHEIHQFLLDFFQSADCPIVKYDRGQFTVQLTVEMDKALMNRPFYWHYVEKTGRKPEPQQLTIITDFARNRGRRGEWIHFGSPRLHQIFRLAKTYGSFIRMYENRPGTAKFHTPLVPWLALNLKISLICDKKMDRLRYFGLNLIDGRLIEPFQKRIEEEGIALSNKMPDFAFTFSPLITPKSGIRRIEKYVEQELAMDDWSWAEKAQKRMAEDLALLEAFYKETEEKPEIYFKEREAIIEQYEPRVAVEIINGGLFYLSRGRFSA